MLRADEKSLSMEREHIQPFVDHPEGVTAIAQGIALCYDKTLKI
jgi:hypothetical protein